jgi:hypothetical protein
VGALFFVFSRQLLLQRKLGCHIIFIQPVRAQRSLGLYAIFCQLWLGAKIVQGKLRYLQLTRLWENWPLWGGVLATFLVAWHSWVLFAPDEIAVPNGVQVSEASDTARLFGTAADAAISSPINGISVIGIFSRRESGFAVLQTPQGQIGVAVGNELMPGVRLLETHANHVVLERAGSRHIIEMRNVPTARTSQAIANPVEVVPPGLEQLPPEQRNMFLKQLGKGIP